MISGDNVILILQKKKMRFIKINKHALFYLGNVRWSQDQNGPRTKTQSLTPTSSLGWGGLWVWSCSATAKVLLPIREKSFT